MKKYDVFIEKARELRRNHKSLNEICQTLNLNKSTVYGWINDIEVEIQRKPSGIAGQKTRETWALKRESYYNKGKEEYDELSKSPAFETFLVLYLCEGYKRNRNTVSITNSDPDIINVSYQVMKKLTNKPPRVSIQIHLDNNIEQVISFWANLLNIDSSKIKTYTRPTSMTNRNGRLEHGICQITYLDTEFRSRLQSWLDIMKKKWSVW